MSHVPHELAEEFPTQTDKIHELKIGNAHFAKLADQYHEINREIHRLETGIEPASELRETQLRKERMTLKDMISTMLWAS
ncbi:YdcH family protein [Lentilitoribacter sp. EG35]|uniref:YdcH family protein n=1 Tax=Lentilitoribacter sp. EG35 TaxID=3234192 RepID=UPI0034611A8E